MAQSSSRLLTVLKSLKISHNLQMSHILNSTVGHKLAYAEHGDPFQVLHQEEETVPDPIGDEVLVKMLASPVNPVDINIIQGKYPMGTSLPAVGGNEGVGEVLKVGATVTGLNVGDHVVPQMTFGLWRTHVVLPKESLLKVPKELGLVEAATLTVNPCTAYRMLRDFADLKPGDTVIQNGANSACGQNVIQLCRAWGIKSVNVVRDRPGFEDLRGFLTHLGATHVLTGEELRKTDIFRSGIVDKPKLALDCVGGRSALEVLRHLQNGSTMVTYGGMSRDPVTVPTSALIFKDLRFRGFSIGQWTVQNLLGSAESSKMFDELISMMINNELKGPAFKMVHYGEFKEAVQNTLSAKGMVGKKYILGFESDALYNITTKNKL